MVRNLPGEIATACPSSDTKDGLAGKYGGIVVLNRMHGGSHKILLQSGNDRTGGFSIVTIANTHGIKDIGVHSAITFATIGGLPFQLDLGPRLFAIGNNCPRMRSAGISLNSQLANSTAISDILLQPIFLGIVTEVLQNLPMRHITLGLAISTPGLLSKRHKLSR